MPEQQRQLVVISGAASGIGLAIVRRLLDGGYGVLAIDRNTAAMDLDDPHLRTEQMDLADIDGLPERIAGLVRELQQPVRALINNAGLGKMGYLEQLSVSDMRLVMNTNFLSHAIVTKAFLPVLKQQQALADVIFTGSEAALQGGRQGSIYCASKFAVRGFAQALREECAKSCVRITLVNPGAVRTPFFDELNFEPGPEPVNAIEPDDIAAAVLAVLAMRAGTVIDEINLSPQTPLWQRKG